jgi:ribonuclease Z
VARSFGHITARQAATLALESGVQSLVLTHVSRRYREYDVVQEARAVFPNTHVARDFDHFVTRRGQPIEKLTPEQRRARIQPETAGEEEEPQND